MPRPAVFFDRHDLETALDLDRAAVGRELGRLRRAGFAVVAASNEPTVASGRRTERDVQEADRLLAAALADEDAGSPIDRFYWCPFSPDAAIDRYRYDHPWRKPRPGMLLQAAEDLELDLERSWMLAGREEDLAAARAAGMRVAALRTIGDGADRLDLAGAAEAILTTTSDRSLWTAETQRTEPQQTEAQQDALREARVRDAELPEVEVMSTEAAADRAMATSGRTGGDEHADATASSSATRRATASGFRGPAGSTPGRGTASEQGRRPALEAKLPASPTPPASPSRDEAMLAAIRELAEEIRQSRAGARELSGGRVVALLLELGVLLAAVMGLLQVSDPMLFAKWFLGAILLQLLAIALLLLDRR